QRPPGPPSPPHPTGPPGEALFGQAPSNQGPSNQAPSTNQAPFGHAPPRYSPTGHAQPGQVASGQAASGQAVSQAPLTDRALEANAYAISYRLLGDRPAAAAVAGIAAERLRQNGQASAPDWLCHLALYTLDQTVAPGVPDVPGVDEDRFASLRLALRRRL